MSTFNGPEIPTDGLIFHYDMQNTKKSWKGTPVTNMWSVASNSSTNNRIWDMPAGGTATLSYESSTQYGTWNGNTIWKISVSAGTIQGYTSFRYCVPASYDSTYGTTRRVLYRVKMLKGDISAIGVHSGGGNSAATGTLISSADVPADVFSNSGWYLFDLNVSGSYTLGHCVGLGIMSADVEFLVTEMMLYPSASLLPFTPTGRTTSQAIIDLSGNSTITANNLTYSNNEFEFLGTGQYMSYNGQAMGSNTIEFVIYNPGTQTDSYPTIHQQVPQNTTNGYTWMYISGNSTTLTYQYCNGTYTSTSFANAIASGGYTHIAVVADHAAQTVTLYKNGEILATNSATGIRPIAAATAYIGNYQGSPNADYDFKGKLPVYRVYNRTLTATEVRNNFISLRARFGL